MAGVNTGSFSSRPHLNGTESAVTPLHYILDSKLDFFNYIEDTNRFVCNLDCLQCNISLINYLMCEYFSNDSKNNLNNNNDNNNLIRFIYVQT
jgi:hypothetical protein